MFLRYEDRLFNLSRVNVMHVFESHITIQGLGQMAQIRLPYGSPQVARFAFERVPDGLMMGWNCMDVSPDEIARVMKRRAEAEKNPFKGLPPLYGEQAEKGGGND